MTNSQWTVSENAHRRLEDSYEHLRSTCEDRATKIDGTMLNIQRLIDDGKLNAAVDLIGLVREDLSTILNHTRSMKRQASDGKQEP